MRSSAYLNPPSRTWVVTMAFGYAALALAGAGVLAAIIFLPQAAEGLLVLGLWGGLVLPGGLMGLYGVLRVRYRYEWVGVWLIIMGTATYLVVTIMGTVALGWLTLFMSAPTILVFIYALLITLGRAIHLGIVDMRARRQVLIERALTGEIPEVQVND